VQRYRDGNAGSVAYLNPTRVPRTLTLYTLPQTQEQAVSTKRGAAWNSVAAMRTPYGWRANLSLAS